MAVAEGINVETLYFMFLIGTLIEGILLLRMINGFLIVANQATLLSVAGNLACAFTVAAGENETYLSVKLPTGAGGVIETLVNDSPATLGFYHIQAGGGFPHFFSVNVPSYGVGRLVKKEEGSSSYILAYYSKFKPRMNIRRSGEVMEVEIN